MENATKALLIAGEVLLAILVLSVGVILYTNFKEDTSSYTQQIDTSRIQQVNAKFENFIGRNDIRIHEIISLSNYIEENKGKLLNQITLKVDSETYLNLTQEMQINKIKEFENKKYEVADISYNTTTGQVKNIEFHEITEII